MATGHPTTTLKAGALYFALVFGAGFVLGSLRIVWVVPRVGERAAELMEMPLMLAVMVLAARWTVRRLAPPRAPASPLGAGIVGVGLVLAAEVVLVRWLRGMTIAQYVASRDPVTGTVYVALLGVMVVLPLLVGRRVGVSG